MAQSFRNRAALSGYIAREVKRFFWGRAEKVVEAAAVAAAGRRTGAAIIAGQAQQSGSKSLILLRIDTAAKAASRWRFSMPRELPDKVELGGQKR